MAALVEVHCTSCASSTKHQIVEQVEVSGFEEERGAYWQAEYQIIRCLGCDSVSFRVQSGYSDDYDPETDEPVKTEALYPERLAGRRPVSGHVHFPPLTRQVYLEVLKALNSGAPILAAIGLRTVIESVCKEQNVGEGNLEWRINQLFELGLLAKAQTDFLHNLRFLGNVAAHEVISPNPTELIAALEIAETLLKTIYVLPRIAASITTGRAPPRDGASPGSTHQPNK